MTTQATAQKRKKAGAKVKAATPDDVSVDDVSVEESSTAEGSAAAGGSTAEGSDGDGSAAEGSTGETKPAPKGAAAAARTAEALAADVTTQGALSDEQTRLAWMIGLSLGTLGTVVAAFLFGPSLAVLVLAGTAAASVIALFWQSLRTLIGEAPLSAADTFAAFSTGTEEEQKRAVLRGMKDLEYERNVGKISEEDYKRLILRYRTEAKSLLRQIDARNEGDRIKAEALVQERLRAAGLADLVATPAKAAAEAPPAAQTATEEAATEEAATTEETATEAATTEAAPTEPAPSADAPEEEDARDGPKHATEAKP